jgi:hypothetical protein
MPGAAKQRREAGIRAGLFGTRDRVAGDDMDAPVGGRLKRAGRFAFDRADISEDGAVLHGGHRASGHCAERAYGHAKDHAISLDHGGLKGWGDGAEADLAGAGAHLRICIEQDDLAGSAIFTRGPGDGRADQAGADNGKAGEDGFRHGNWLSGGGRRRAGALVGNGPFPVKRRGALPRWCTGTLRPIFAA